MKTNPFLFNKKVLVVGATGMAGQAFTKQLILNRSLPIGLSRNGPDIYLDASKEEDKLREKIQCLEPSLIINCAAIVSLPYCEHNPSDAFAVNSSKPNILAECAYDSGAKFIHISTDHFYSGDTNSPHSEDYPLALLNKYAESKRAGELNALKNPNSLILRTNIAGKRGNLLRPTFSEWLIDSIIKRKPMRLFTDFFTSTLDVSSFARYALSSNILSFNGVLNLASSTTSSKKILRIALKSINIRLDWAEDSSVKDLEIPRAESLGLDCSKAEKIIGQAMPDLVNVCKSLAKNPLSLP